MNSHNLVTHVKCSNTAHLAEKPPEMFRRQISVKKLGDFLTLDLPDLFKWMTVTFNLNNK